jgi:hypothetical protein
MADIEEIIAAIRRLPACGFEWVVVQSTIGQFIGTMRLHRIQYKPISGERANAMAGAGAVRAPVSASVFPSIAFFGAPSLRAGAAAIRRAISSQSHR